MKYIKLIAITLIAVIVLFLAMAFISPSTTTVERSVIVIGKQDSVFSEFSKRDWNHNEKVERVISGDSLIQLQFYIGGTEIFVNGSMKFKSNADTVFVTYVNEVALPLTMRMMASKVTERMIPEMDKVLFDVKHEIEDSAK